MTENDKRKDGPLTKHTYEQEERVIYDKDKIAIIKGRGPDGDYFIKLGDTTHKVRATTLTKIKNAHCYIIILKNDE